MIEVTMLVMKAVALLWLLALNLVGFLFGFGAFVGVLACVALALWLYWRYVACGAREEDCSVFVGYYMEVV